MAIFDEFPYTNFHDKNLDGMCKAIGKNREDIAKNTEQITILKGRMQIAEQQIDQHANQIANLSGRMVTAETQILQNRNSILDLSGRMTTAENDIDNHESRITALEQGGGGGFSWTSGTMTTTDGSQQTFYYNTDTMMVLIPETNHLFLKFSTTQSEIVKIEDITIPENYKVKFVMPMCVTSSAGDQHQYETISMEWLVTKRIGGEVVCSYRPLTYSAPSSLKKADLSTFPIYGVILPNT